jgi:hypothetical protein
MAPAIRIGSAGEQHRQPQQPPQQQGRRQQHGPGTQELARTGTASKKDRATGIGPNKKRTRPKELIIPLSRWRFRNYLDGELDKFLRIVTRRKRRATLDLDECRVRWTPRVRAAAKIGPGPSTWTWTSDRTTKPTLADDFSAPRAGPAGDTSGLPIVARRGAATPSGRFRFRLREARWPAHRRRPCKLGAGGAPSSRHAGLESFTVTN